MNPGRSTWVLALVFVLWSVVSIALAANAAGGTPEPMPTLPIGAGAVQGAFSPNGENLAIACMDGTIKLFDTETWDLIWESTLHEAEPINCVVFSPGGGSVVASVKGEDLVVFLDPRTGREVRRIVIPEDLPGTSGASAPGFRFRMWEFAFSPDGRLLACADGSLSKSVILLDSVTGRFLSAPVFLGGGNEIHVLFSPDGRLLACSNIYKRIVVWDVENEEEAASLKTIGLGALTSIAFSPDGRLLAAGGGDSSVVLLWDTSTWESTRLSVSSKGAGGAVAFSSDGRFFASGYKDLRIWSAETLDLISTSAVCPKGTVWMRFSPDGALLVVSKNIGRPATFLIPSSSLDVWETSALLGE